MKIIKAYGRMMFGKAYVRVVYADGKQQVVTLKAFAAKVQATK